MLSGKKILLIIGGGIAAYKSLDLIRRMRDAGATVTPVLTRAAEEFVTPLSTSALAAQKVYRDLFDLTDEAEMGHIELSRAADLVVVAPATADLMAKMANGMANDLASTLLMATDKPVLIAPAMNVRMWQHPATQRNLAVLQGDGIFVVGPDDGNMACGEFGPGRMSEVPDIIAAASAALGQGPLAGKHIIVTSGPTHEPIDPVRYIANRSSGAQGTALAIALRDLGANVSFVTGPATAPRPNGVTIIEVQTAAQMYTAIRDALPADAAVFAAAVADWHVLNAADAKIKKSADGALPSLSFAENPDILAIVSQLLTGRPPLVVGFAAETSNVVDNAKGKLVRKGCDWIVANDVSSETGIMGGSENKIHLVTANGVEDWPRLTKVETARRLAVRIADTLAPKSA
ncbi:MAG: phosphopantothenoylcysteine decarboxylase/phosphopantothenate--cysteine ligase [Paracoccaceae bacterium]|jgi:phosphopantothenoylcysteine decarboxylase/phosphopantothenate--cysteine ligase